MPSPRTFIGAKTTTEALRSHLVFTAGRLRRHPLTQGHVATFQQLIVKVDTVEAQAKVLADDLDDAQVEIYVADDGLNDLASKVWKVVGTITKDPAAPVRKVLFGDKNLSDYSRPILGNQYTQMTQWPEALGKSEHPALQALAAEAIPLLEAAAAAIAHKAAAETAKKLFREVGDRAKLFAEANTARKKLYGELSALPHEHPELPSSFADRFFRRDTVENEAAEEEPEPAPEATIESVKAEIERLTKLIEEQQALLTKLEAKAKTDAEEALERQADEARLQQIEEEEKARAKEKATLLAKLDKNKK